MKMLLSIVVFVFFSQCIKSQIKISGIPDNPEPDYDYIFTDWQLETRAPTSKPSESISTSIEEKTYQQNTFRDVVKTTESVTSETTTTFTTLISTSTSTISKMTTSRQKDSEPATQQTTIAVQLYSNGKNYDSVLPNTLTTNSSNLPPLNSNESLLSTHSSKIDSITVTPKKETSVFNNTITNTSAISTSVSNIKLSLLYSGLSITSSLLFITCAFLILKTRFRKYKNRLPVYKPPLRSLPSTSHTVELEPSSIVTPTNTPSLESLSIELPLVTVNPQHQFIETPKTKTQETSL